MIDDDLDAPQAIEALGEFADAILSGGTDTTAPAVLAELGALDRCRRHPSGLTAVTPSGEY